MINLLVLSIRWILTVWVPQQSYKIPFFSRLFGSDHPAFGRLLDHFILPVKCNIPLSQTLTLLTSWAILPPFVEQPNFSNQFSFPLEGGQIHIPLFLTQCSSIVCNNIPFMARFNSGNLLTGNYLQLISVIVKAGQK